jgi:hypothetical protein
LAKGVLVKENVAAPFTSMFLSSPLSSKLLVVNVVSDSTQKETVLLLTLKSRLEAAKGTALELTKPKHNLP